MDQQTTVPKGEAICPASHIWVAELSFRLPSVWLQSLAPTPSSHSCKCLRSYWGQPQVMWVPRAARKREKEDGLQGGTGVLICTASCRWTEPQGRRESLTFLSFKIPYSHTNMVSYVMKLINVICKTLHKEMHSLILLILSRLA